MNPEVASKQNKDLEAEPPPSGRRQHGMARADRGDMTLRRGGRGSMVPRACYATGETLLVPERKTLEQVRPNNRLNRERKEGEKVAEGFAVAMNWGNSQGAKEPSCFVIPLAMMGGRGV